MKKLTLVLSSCALALSAAQAQAEVSANVAMSTDYIWRGVTQTAEDPAVSGGFDYSHASGAYVGTWGSNVAGGSEFDLYGGYSTDITDAVSVDVGFIRYMYPSNGTVNFSEVYANVSAMGFTAGVAHGLDDAGDYYSLSYEYGLPMEATLSASVGYYDFDAADSDTTDIKLAVSREYEGFGFELSYFDLSSDAPNSDDDGIVFTVSKSM